jgi:hypothetical protein
MTGDRFANLLKAAFNPFLSDLGFKAEEVHKSGRYYRANFVRDLHTLVVSFEPGDSQLTAMLVRNDDNDVTAIDDVLITPRLGDLNERYQADIVASERKSNEEFFSSIKVEGRDEQTLLKCAKDLRLVLPRHLYHR